MNPIPTIGMIYPPRATDLILVAACCSVAGAVLLWKGIKGDTLMPGTLFTYLPKWLFIALGLLFQLPLPLAFWYLDWVRQL